MSTTPPRVSKTYINREKQIARALHYADASEELMAISTSYK